jgi:uncharacterized membrane protein HdeD (DUF308 family)
MEFEDLVRDNLGKIMIGVGILAVIFGIFMLDSFGTFASVSSLFIGVLLIVYGFFLQVGLFSVKWRSMNGIGTVLLCISVGFFALAIVALQFQIVHAESAVEVFRGLVIPFMRLSGTRPFVYLFALCLQIGLGVLAAGIALKIYSHFGR